MSLDESPSTTGITEADRKRMSGILRKARNEKVLPEECSNLRLRVDGDEWPEDIVEDVNVPWEESTIKDHAYGRCDHDISTKPATPPNQRDFITRSECARMQQLLGEGETGPSIIDQLELDCNVEVVYRHGNDNCNHELNDSA